MGDGHGHSRVYVPLGVVQGDIQIGAVAMAVDETQDDTLTAIWIVQYVLDQLRLILIAKAEQQRIGGDFEQGYFFTQGQPLVALAEFQLGFFSDERIGFDILDDPDQVRGEQLADNAQRNALGEFWMLDKVQQHPVFIFMQAVNFFQFFLADSGKLQFFYYV